ncbi:MBL fold metallo-hydrolase [Rossellomorea vietnamensis]|uniref:MBL fold metallo-hydrolase n=1 Tax=Rossellomorea vietnamensis TaxID=218284 RepID=A0A5D4M7L1_9BACI|nr:MBL fold metallo-hydrolase [Rossellomorea vietnamensis]TYR97642.1 MBL fold metallo-hydrolase [Rossellomorea vietnamensis]
MELKKINESCFYFSSAVNVGYIKKEGEGLLIDTGIDDSSIKKVLKILESENLPLNFCIITHAHTDHFGGASYLKKKTDIKMYAPKLEKTIIENPLLEPVYLWNGAFPLKELRSKFLEGKPVEVDESIVAPGDMEIGPFKLEAVLLPGHSIGQVGIIHNEILFAADAYFAKEALKKHVVPFITDAEQTFLTLEKLKNLKVEGSVPGHGEFEKDFSESIDANIEVHMELLKQILKLLDKNQGRHTFEGLLQEFLNINDIESRSLGQYLLYRTSFTAYITKLIHDGSAKAAVESNQLYINL